MKTAFYAVAIVCTVALSVAALVFLGRLTKVATDLDEQIMLAGKGLQDVETKVDRVVDGAAASEFRQAVYWDQTARQTAGTVKALRLFLDRTDKSLNDKLLPDANHAILALTLDTHDFIQQATKSTEQLTVAGNATLDGATVSFDTLRTRMNDRRLDEILGNVQSTTFELAGTTADIHTEIHRFVYPPPRKWWQREITDPLKFAARMVTIPLR